MDYSASVFILTGETEDFSGKTPRLRYFGRSPELGPVEIEFTGFPYVCFGPDADTGVDLPEHTQRAGVVKNFSGEYMRGYYCDNRDDLRKLSDSLKGEGQELLETDLKAHERFLMELGVRGGAWIEGSAREKDGRIYFKNPQIRAFAVKTDFRKASIDIENGVNIDKLFSIAVHLTGCGPERKKVFMLDESAYEMNDFTTCYSNETDLLNAFLTYIEVEDPDIIIGWNVIGYDLNQLQRYCERNYLDFKFDRQGREPNIFSPMMGVSFAFMAGRVVIEGMSAIRDMGYTFKNNRLETVANNILGEGKLIHDEEDKLGEIERQFVEEKENLAKYNLQDVELVTRLYEKIGVVEFMASRVCATGVLMSQLEINNSIPENLLIPELHRELFASPGDGEKKQSRNDALRFLSSSAGVHENVYSFDTPNMLAFLAATFRLGPLAAVSVHESSEELPWAGKTNKEKALLARVLDDLFQLREKALEAERPWQVRAVDHTFKQVMTTVLESSNRFFSAQFKSAITLAMNWFLDQLKEVLDQQNCRVIAYNEETLYIAAEDESTTGEKLASVVNHGMNERISLQQYQSPCKLLEFTKYHKRILFVNRNNDKFLRFAYLSDVGDEELKITGLYNNGPSWAPLSSYFQDALFKQVLGGNDWKAWIRDFVADFRDGAHRDKIAYLRKVKKSDLLDKKDQPHIQAALKLNRHLNVISYIMTLDDGAVPKEMNPRSPNIDHYIDTQIARVANVVLSLEGKIFDDLFRAEQLSLFEF